ncbi:UDP-glucose 4-epimerase [Fusarium oxysporum f. sp. albedinis]|nr:UDP-glucose 4-epimerase [Fusarium oxysporum f. sp. albedinis]
MGYARGLAWRNGQDIQAPCRRNNGSGNFGEDAIYRYVIHWLDLNAEVSVQRKKCIDAIPRLRSLALAAHTQKEQVEVLMHLLGILHNLERPIADFRHRPDTYRGNPTFYATLLYQLPLVIGPLPLFITHTLLPSIIIIIIVCRLAWQKALCWIYNMSSYR